MCAQSKAPRTSIFTLIRWVATSYQIQIGQRFDFHTLFFCLLLYRNVFNVHCVSSNDGHGIVFADVRAIYHEKLMNKKVKGFYFDNVTPFVITSGTVKCPSTSRSMDGPGQKVAKPKVCEKEIEREREK